MPKRSCAPTSAPHPRRRAALAPPPHTHTHSSSLEGAQHGLHALATHQSKHAHRLLPAPHLAVDVDQRVVGDLRSVRGWVGGERGGAQRGVSEQGSG